MCINALNFGMTYEQFWNTDLSAYYIYSIAFKEKKDNKRKDMDIMAWEIGEYMISALHHDLIAVCLPMSNKEMRNSRTPYPKMPYSMEKESKNNEKSKKRKIVTTPPTAEEEAEYRKFLASLRKR